MDGNGERIERYEGGFGVATILSQGWKEGSVADIHARILKKPCCRGELDRAIIYNVDVPAGTLSPDSDQRPQTSTPRYKKPFRDLVERGRVMRAYRKPKEQRREIRERVARVF